MSSYDCLHSDAPIEKHLPSLSRICRHMDKENNMFLFLHHTQNPLFQPRRETPSF